MSVLYSLPDSSVCVILYVAGQEQNAAETVGADGGVFRVIAAVGNLVASTAHRRIVSHNIDEGAVLENETAAGAKQAAVLTEFRKKQEEWKRHSGKERNSAVVAAATVAFIADDIGAARSLRTGTGVALFIVSVVVTVECIYLLFLYFY